MAFGRKHKQVEDEAPVETPEPTPPPAEEKPPVPVQYAPGEGSQQHPF